MEENRRFSLTDLLIKVILVIVFILLAVWLLSISNKKMTNSLDVLTDKIFAENIDRMKEVGKEYFTIERLPKKVGEIETITLQEMYDKDLILPVKYKNGNLCDADDSYVSIEKFDNEYQMKVNLDCRDEEDSIIVIMGCYDYCDGDICEKEEVKEEYIKGEVAETIEYEYKKTTNGRWTDYGAWSQWSKVEVSKNDYRQVETKVVEEEYIHETIITDTLFESVKKVCPEGYKKTADGTKCYKANTTNSYEDATCPDMTSQGYKFVSQDGFTCTYTKTNTLTSEPTTCASTYDGYTLVSQDGFTCNYSKSVQTPYQVKVTTTNKKTCYTQKVVKPCASCAPVTQNVPYDCSTTSTSYVTKYKTETTTTTTTVSCPTGYSNVNGTCTKYDNVSKTENAICPTGFTQSGNSCVKADISYDYKNIIKTCSTDYQLTSDGTSCYKDVEDVIVETGVEKVTYYRYRVREYVGGTTDYKWSTSKNDKNLLNAGYKLTGRTR